MKNSKEFIVFGKEVDLLYERLVNTKELDKQWQMLESFYLNCQNELYSGGCCISIPYREKRKMLFESKNPKHSAIACLIQEIEITSSYRKEIEASIRSTEILLEQTEICCPMNKLEDPLEDIYRKQRDCYKRKLKLLQEEKKLYQIQLSHTRQYFGQDENGLPMPVID